MITILVDHNIEGQALMLWRLITTEGWSELLPLQFIMFSQVDYPPRVMTGQFGVLLKKTG